MALEAGADDYVTSDCNPLELLARVKSQLRRYIQLVNMCANINRIYRMDGLVIDDIQEKVTVEGRAVRLFVLLNYCPLSLHRDVIMLVAESR